MTLGRCILIAVLAGLGALAAVGATPSHATFAGQNGLLAYQATVGAHTELFTVKADGTGAKQLTDWTDSDAINAAWSPDGTHIVFVRHWLKPQEHFRIYTINSDGSELRGLNDKLRGTPIWTPDGRHLLLVRNLKFVVVNADGTGAKDAGVPGLPGDPCFLGHSERVAELVSRSDGESSIFVGRIGGGRGSLKRITPWQGMTDKIDCSPDGTRVAFSSPQIEPSESASANVYTVRSDGTGLQKLTHNVGGKIHNGFDSWSPNGRQIAFVSDKTGTYEIYSMDADGSHVTQITHGPEAHLASWGTVPN